METIIVYNQRWEVIKTGQGFKRGVYVHIYAARHHGETVEVYVPPEVKGNRRLKMIRNFMEEWIGEQMRANMEGLL